MINIFNKNFSEKLIIIYQLINFVSLIAKLLAKLLIIIKNKYEINQPKFLVALDILFLCKANFMSKLSYKALFK